MNIGTLEKIRVEWQNEHVRGCEVKSVIWLATEAMELWGSHVAKPCCHCEVLWELDLHFLKGWASGFNF